MKPNEVLTSLASLVFASTPFLIQSPVDLNIAKDRDCLMSEGFFREETLEYLVGGKTFTLSPYVLEAAAVFFVIVVFMILLAHSRF